MLRPGDRVGDWMVERPLGEGGMGAVYLATNALTGRIRAALKVIKPLAFAEERERFVREVEALDALRHDAIVGVKGWGEDPERGLLWMAMDFVEGEEITARLARGAMPLGEAAAVFSVVADGLQYAHERGFRHRDIKPSNILIDSTGVAHLVDFGIAVADGRTRLTAEGKMPGTPAYMAPEVFEVRKPDPAKMDIYALGQVLYEALTGRAAFPENPDLAGRQQIVHLIHQKVKADPLDPGAEFPDDVRELVKAATHPSPEQRLPDAASLRDGLLPHIANERRFNLPIRVTLPPMAAGPTLSPSTFPSLTLPPAAERPTAPASPPPAPRSRLPMLLGGVSAVAVAVVGGWFGWQALQPPPFRDAVVVVAGIASDTPVVVGVNGQPPTGNEGLEFLFEDVPVGAMKVSVAAGDQCDFLAFDGETCPACCSCEIATYTLAPGFEPDLTPVTLTPPEAATSRPVVVLVEGLQADVEARILIDGQPEPARDGPHIGRWDNIPLGAYDLVVEAGTCAPEAAGCMERQDCPAGCRSMKTRIGIPCGTGEVRIGVELEAPEVIPSAPRPTGLRGILPAEISGPLNGVTPEEERRRRRER
jgi:serine/threonine protein kinase